MSLDPFRRAYCPAAWVGAAYLGMSDPVVWRRTEISGHVHASGLRELLRRAQLPERELRHMGASAWLLEPSCPEWVDGELAVQVLGRIMLDEEFGTFGDAWSGLPEQAARAAALGRVVIREYFTP